MTRQHHIGMGTDKTGEAVVINTRGCPTCHAFHPEVVPPLKKWGWGRFIGFNPFLFSQASLGRFPVGHLLYTM